MHGRLSTSLLIVAAVALAGCGSKVKSTTPNDGILWISWTVRGQPVSPTACNSVDHLSLTMDTAAGALSIDPIPCLRGVGWEYDGLPEGSNYVILDGYDVRGAITLEGSAPVDVIATKPLTPAPIDLLSTR
ncbi:MAG: hypothetical protein JWM53_1585 [bacterium]|nr:hypothetical protein [bacterium]